jgi:hypothetical protein
MNTFSNEQTAINRITAQVKKQYAVQLSPSWLSLQLQRNPTLITQPDISAVLHAFLATPLSETTIPSQRIFCTYHESSTTSQSLPSHPHFSPPECNIINRYVFEIVALEDVGESGFAVLNNLMEAKTALEKNEKSMEDVMSSLKKGMLKVTLTDGTTSHYGFELGPVDGLHLLTCPGTKVKCWMRQRFMK